MIKRYIKEFKEFDLAKRLTIVFLFILPVLDMMTALFKGTSLQFGLVIKGLFIVYVVINLFLRKPAKIALILGLFFLSVFVQTFLNPTFSTGILVQNAIGMFKFYYFIILAVWLVQLHKEGKGVNARDIFLVWFILIGGSFVVSWFTGTYFRTYPWLVSTKSWYYAGNEISSFLMALFPVIMHYVLKFKNKLLSFFSLALMVLIASYMGTKTIYFGFLGFAIIYSIYVILFKFLKNTKLELKSTVLCIITVCSLIAIYPITPVGAQIEDHVNIIEDDRPGTTLPAVPGEPIIEKPSYYPDIFEDYPTINLINKLLKNRLVRVYETGLDFVEKSPSALVFGIGTYQINNDHKIIQVQTEMDFFTVLFRYGFVGLLVLFIFLFIILRQMVRTLRTNSKNRLSVLTLSYSILILIASAFFAGHVLIAPLVNVIFPVLLIALIDLERGEA